MDEHIEPEIYKFPNQSKEDVLKMLNEEKPATTEYKKYKKLQEEFPDSSAKPKLLFDDEVAPSYVEEPYINCRGSRFKPEEQKQNSLTLAIWRKLAGVRPEENVEVADKIPTIMDTVIMLCKRKFTENVTASWSDDGWRACLVINGAKTKINADNLIAAVQGLQEITDEDDATRIVSNTIVKKLERLFI